MVDDTVMMLARKAIDSDSLVCGILADRLEELGQPEVAVLAKIGRPMMAMIVHMGNQKSSLALLMKKVGRWIVECNINPEDHKLVVGIPSGKTRDPDFHTIISIEAKNPAVFHFSLFLSK